LEKFLKKPKSETETDNAARSHLLYKCPEVKSTEFKSQEKRERMGGKTVGVHAVGGGGGGADGQKETKKERNK
jgi:hypothetical protein